MVINLGEHSVLCTSVSHCAHAYKKELASLQKGNLYTLV